MVGAGQRVKMTLPDHIFSYQSLDEVFLTISFRLRSAMPWADASHEVAWWQRKLSSPQAVLISQPTPQTWDKLNVSNSQVASQITGPNWSLRFDRVRGYITHWTSSGITLLEADPKTGAAIIPSFWRAPTDNDVPGTLPYWRRFGLDNLTSQLRSLVLRRDDKAGFVEIETNTYLSPPILSWGYNVKTTYTISSSGSLSIILHIRPSGSHPDTVPRVGLDVYQPRTFDQVSWLGPGPGESYPDKRSSQRVGIWRKIVSELQTNYEHPQENGNRMDTRWVMLLNSQCSGIKVTESVNKKNKDSEGTFQWGVGWHTAATLEAARHPCDLVEEDATLLKLNAEVAGLGSAACGPGPKEEFQVKCREREFGFLFEKVQI